uniref:acyltransferase family protein n=1 Tax=Niallia circulans TaxID=1397 RepID=UPI0026ED231A
MKKEIINEIFLLRSISCLAVVLIHSIGFALENVDHYNSLDEKMLAIIRTILNFGTPTFIFISEFLLAKSYPDKVPKGFFIKRFKFLLIPYIFMAFFYALIDIQNNEMRFLFSNILIETFKNIFLADYTGYFVVIIFQFYILHTLLNKTLKKYKPTMVLSISLLINLIYLGFFNFTNPLSEYIWYYSSWMPFVGWVFYFTMGYYCGTHYRYFKTLLNKYKLSVYIMPILTLIFVLGLRYMGLLTIPSSKTVGILIFTPAMICLIVHLSLKMKRIPYLMPVSYTHL